MLALLGFAMVATFMTLIMTRRAAPLVALIVVPVVFGLIAGHGLDLGPMMLEGVKKIAPTGVMIMFAILYFGLMIDAGLFDPAVRRLLVLVRGDPVRVVVGTVVLAVGVSLGGNALMRWAAEAGEDGLLGTNLRHGVSVELGYLLDEGRF
jgi:CitMHS family citrate-Mg2+:H+ or citrate-Ca2+:H+ symporter